MRLISYNLLLAFLLLPNVSEAADEKKIADTVSYVSVTAQVALDTIHNLHSENKKEELIREGLAIGMTVILSEIAKHLVNEKRPDGSDNLSFWSEHTAIAASTQGWNFKIGVPLTVITGTGRVIAKKHYIWDVLAGAGAGTLAGAIVK